MTLKEKIAAWTLAAVAFAQPIQSLAAAQQDVACTASAQWQASKDRETTINEIKTHGYTNYRVYVAVMDDAYKLLDQRNIDYGSITTGPFIDALSSAFAQAAQQHGGQLKAIKRTPVLNITGPVCSDIGSRDCSDANYSIPDLNKGAKPSQNDSVIRNLGGNEQIPSNFSMTAYFNATGNSMDGGSATLIQAIGKFDIQTPFPMFAAGMITSFNKDVEISGNPPGNGPEPSIPAKVWNCKMGIQDPTNHLRR